MAVADFGDNLQAMKRLLEMKRAGELCNADGTRGVRLVYIDPPFATMQEFHGSEDRRRTKTKWLALALWSFFGNDLF